MTLPTRPSSLGRQQVFLGYASRTDGLNVSAKAGLSESTHWSLLASYLHRSEGSVHNWLILSRRIVVWVFLGQFSKWRFSRLTNLFLMDPCD